MPPVNLQKIGVGIAVGALDEVAERLDMDNGRTEPFQTFDDWGRAIAVAGGHALGMWNPRYFEIGETVATAATPLLVKSISRAVKMRGGAGTAAYNPAAARRAAARNWAPSNPGAVGWRAPS